MSASQYNRGSRVIAREAEARLASMADFQLIEDLNSIPKLPDARRPFGPLLFKYDGQRWWALDPVKQFGGLGFYFPSLRAAVAAFRVTITQHDATEITFTGAPY